MPHLITDDGELSVNKEKCHMTATSTIWLRFVNGFVSIITNAVLYFISVLLFDALMLLMETGHKSRNFLQIF